MKQDLLLQGVEIARQCISNWNTEMSLSIFISDQSVHLEGDGESLLDFAKGMVEPQLPRDWPLARPHRSTPRGSDYFASSVRVQETAGKITVALQNADVVITGERRHLELVGNCIRYLAEDRTHEPFSAESPGCLHFDTEEYLSDVSWALYVYRIE